MFVVVWMVIACVVAGAVAGVTDMPSLWGSGPRFVEYALPIPFAWGLLHWPGLIVFGGLLKAATARPQVAVPVLQYIAAGTTVGVLAAYLLVPAVRGFPLFMYLAVDAVLALLASTWVPGARPVQPPSRRARLIMLSGPTLVVALAVGLWPFFGERYRVSMTDTLVQGGRESLRVWTVRRRGGDDPGAECEGLQALADQYRNRFKDRRTGTPMGGTIYLFRDVAGLRNRNAATAWVTYAWEAGQPDRCSAR